MQFLGLDNFLRDKDSFLHGLKNVNNSITNIKLFDGIFDSLYVSLNPSLEQYDNGMPSEWQYKEQDGSTLNITVLMANFEGTPNAGESEIDTQAIDAIRIKRRIKNTNDVWNTIYERKIQDASDLTFKFVDFLCKNNCNYQYCIATVKGGTETYYDITDIHSTFDGIYFTDGRVQYGTIFDIESGYNRKTLSSTVQPINSRFPVSIKNGHVNYSEGNITARLLKVDENCDVDLENGYQYRKEIIDFLSESNALVFKNYDGFIAIVSIGDDIAEQFSEHYLAPKVSFSWTQIGDAENFIDLEEHGLIGGEE